MINISMIHYLRIDQVNIFGMYTLFNIGAFHIIYLHVIYDYAEF